MGMSICREWSNNAAVTLAVLRRPARAPSICANPFNALKNLADGACKSVLPLPWTKADAAQVYQ
ncbi:hypothetical protein KCP74_16260 [Salmonella enterica subsp. enterica]|nr:hypothetical protein KCP74_16260 [Salmonella enterica subsp. enterica]